MVKKINLDMSTVENREMRLGTIIGWDGKASQLIEESDYEGRSEKKLGHGCGGGKGNSCRLCELKSPLNQQTMCANAIVECQIGNIEDCILIQHAPIGCSADNPWFNLAFHMGLVRAPTLLKRIWCSVQATNSEEPSERRRNALIRKPFSSAWHVLPPLLVKTSTVLPKRWKLKLALRLYRCTAKGSEASTGAQVSISLSTVLPDKL